MMNDIHRVDLFQVLVHSVQLCLEVHPELWSLSFERRSQQVVIHGEHFRAQVDVLHL
jgi:hypothetical protein